MRGCVIAIAYLACGCGKLADLGDERTLGPGGHAGSVAAGGNAGSGAIGGLAGSAGFDAGAGSGGSAGSSGGGGSSGSGGSGGSVVDASFDGSAGADAGDSDAGDGRIWCTSGPILWVRTFGDASDDTARAMVPDGEGGVYVAGQFAGALDFGEKPLVSTGQTDLFLARLDGDGLPHWSKKLGGLDAQGTEQTLAGAGVGFVFAGGFTGTVDFGGGTKTASGISDAFIARYDASGTHVWSTTFDGSGLGDIYVASAAVDAATGAAYATLTFSNNLTFGGQTYTGFGAKDGFLATLDAAGNAGWRVQLGGTGDDAANALALTSDGRVVLGGVSNGGQTDFGGGTLSSATPGYDAVAGLYTSSGTAEWTKRWGDAGNVDVRRVAVDPTQDDVLLTGSIRLSASADFGGGPLSANYGGFVVRLTKAGNYLAGKAFESFQEQRAIAVDASGNALVGGVFTNVVDFGTKIASKGFGDGVVAKLGKNMELVWTIQLGSLADDEIRAIAADQQHDVFVLGHFRESAELTGCGTLVSAGGTDLVLMKLKP